MKNPQQQANISQTPKKNPAFDRALLDRVMEFERPRIQALLKDAQLPASGSKEDLRYFLEQALKTGAVSMSTVERQVLEWEPWTHRHYYFIKIPKDVMTQLSERDTLLSTLAEADLKGRLEATAKFYIPGALKIDCVSLEQGKLTVTMIAPLFTYERRPAEDKFPENSDMIFEAKRRKRSRKVYVLELNVRTGRGFLSIPSVQRGRTYGAEFATVEKLIKNTLKIPSLVIIPIDAAVENLMNDDQAISNSLQVKFSSGHKVSIKSPKKASALFDDQKMKKIEKISRDGHYAEGAFYYVDEPAKPEFRFKIHDDQRLGIFTDLNEPETRDVLELVLGNL